MGPSRTIRQWIAASAALLVTLGLLTGALLTTAALGDGDEPPGARLGEDLRPLEAQAREFVQDGRVLRALHELPGPDVPREVQADPERFLAGHDIRVPDGLRIRFIRFPGAKTVAPGFESFSIRQFDCRTYYLWTNDENGRHLETVEFCRGFEVVPAAVPGPR
jgi:hypothetical protein